MQYTAPPSSALGQLQRGRGAGWLHAVAAKNGVDLLLTCLRHEPRWDGQVEGRAWYYATLARSLGMTAAKLAAAEIDNNYSLGHSILARFAKWGDKTVIPLLRQKLLPGPYDYFVAGSLAEVPGGIDNLDVWIAEHFEGDALNALIARTYDQLPWETWAVGRPQFKTFFRANKEIRRQGRRPMKKPPLDAPLKVILEHHDGTYRDPAFIDRFVTTAKAKELRHLRDVAVGPMNKGRVFALLVLAKRRDPCALELAERTFAADAVGIERSSLYRYIQALDAKDTLPLARRWLGLNDSRAGIAATLMNLHGQADDVPEIRAALRRAWDEQNMYTLCSLIDALARHKAQGPYPELHMIYTDSSYSYARKRAVATMAEVDPDFPCLFAHEALWDCEIETRRTGIDHADRSDPAIAMRIAELTDMRHDEDCRG
jgi:hypothetical protein